MKLLVEQVQDTQFLTEADESGNKKHYITGIFMQSEIKNRNGRFYPKHILENEVNRYIGEKVINKTAWGELSHPNSPTINPDRVSHIIETITPSGNDFIGKARVLDTPCGKIVRGLMEGGKIGVSTRGLGTLKEDLKNGYNIVQDDFHLCTAADVVLDPSAPSAFVTGLMEEKEWSLNEITGEWTYETIKNLKKMTKEQREEKAVKIFAEFMNRLTGK